MLNKTFKYPIVLILLLNVNQLFAQSKWSLGGSASVDYSYRFHENGGDIYFWEGKTLNYYEYGQVGFTVAVKAKYQITKKFLIISGLGFWQNNYRTRNISTANLIPIDPNDPIPLPSDYDFEYSREYFQIPILVSFYWGNKLKLGFSAGTAINFATSQQMTSNFYFKDRPSVTQSTNLLDKSGADLLFMSGIIAAGAAYNYNNLEFRLEPTFNCKFYDISPKSPISLWNAGLNLSVFYKL
jgi:hypothetical protein